PVTVAKSRTFVPLLLLTLPTVAQPPIRPPGSSVTLGALIVPVAEKLTARPAAARTKLGIEADPKVSVVPPPPTVTFTFVSPGPRVRVPTVWAVGVPALRIRLKVPPFEVIPRAAAIRGLLFA